MVWLAGVLLLLGGLLQLYGLWTIAVDVRDAARETERIASEKDTLIAANKHVVADWITRVAVGTVGDIARRKRGVIAIAAGIALQTTASVLALSS